jgi:hypothetical protein
MRRRLRVCTSSVSQQLHTATHAYNVKTAYLALNNEGDLPSVDLTPATRKQQLLVAALGCGTEAAEGTQNTVHTAL